LARGIDDNDAGTLYLRHEMRFALTTSLLIFKGIVEFDLTRSNLHFMNTIEKDIKL